MCVYINECEENVCRMSGMRSIESNKNKIQQACLHPSRPSSLFCMLTCIFQAGTFRIWGLGNIFSCMLWNVHMRGLRAGYGCKCYHICFSNHENPTLIWLLPHHCPRKGLNFLGFLLQSPWSIEDQLSCFIGRQSQPHVGRMHLLACQ